MVNCQKHNEIWEKICNSIKKEFYSGPVYNEKYLKTKIKSYNGKIYTNFHINKMPKEGVFSLFFLSVILIDSVCRICKIYYLQVFLGGFKYVVKQKKMPEYINNRK